MGSQRINKVAEMIHKEISALLVRGLKDPRIGFVTITAVDVVPGLHLARIFYTVMGDEKARRDTEAGLKSCTPFLRREIGKQLQLRHTPELLFEYDTSIAYGNRIESILKDIHDKDSHDRGDSQGD